MYVVAFQDDEPLYYLKFKSFPFKFPMRITGSIGMTQDQIEVIEFVVEVRSYRHLLFMLENDPAIDHWVIATERGLLGWVETITPLDVNEADELDYIGLSRLSKRPRKPMDPMDPMNPISPLGPWASKPKDQDELKPKPGH